MRLNVGWTLRCAVGQEFGSILREKEYPLQVRKEEWCSSAHERGEGDRTGLICGAA